MNVGVKVWFGKEGHDRAELRIVGHDHFNIGDRGAGCGRGRKPIAVGMRTDELAQERSFAGSRRPQHQSLRITFFGCRQPESLVPHVPGVCGCCFDIIVEGANDYRIEMTFGLGALRRVVPRRIAKDIVHLIDQ